MVGHPHFLPFAGAVAEQPNEKPAKQGQGVSNAKRTMVGIVGKITVLPSEGLLSNPPLPEKIVALRDRFTSQYALDRLVCEAPGMARVAQQVRLAASTPMPVLLVGEAGAGKHWMARLVHQLGSDPVKPFCRLDCRRLPVTVLAQFFAPDAASAPPWTGTVYFENVSSLPRELQDRLAEKLHVADRGSARFLAGLGAEPEEEVRSGRVLPGLHAALSVLTINLPPLRERLPDLPRLIEQMLERAGAAADHPVSSVSTEALDLLRKYRWPGNLRELYEVLVGACGRAKGDRLEPTDLPFHVTSTPLPAEPALPLDALLQKVEERLIRVALRLAKNNKTRAAELLAVWRPRLLRRMEALGITDQS
jgi:DNA-binding NtrC family response regulator